MNPDLQRLLGGLEAWLARTELFPDHRLHVDLILNPGAGAFTRRGRCRRLLADLEAALAARPAPPTGTPPGRSVEVHTWVTEYPGHEKQILAHLRAADPCGPGDRRLVVVAGGDGTSRGALISSLDLEPAVRSDLVFFRLPLGTGNDAADARSWTEALAALAGRVPIEVRPLPVLTVRARNLAVHHSFNIASVGLDAFVADLTNRLKAWFPGDSYGLMVDAAAFFYEAFVRVVPSRLVLTQQGTKVVEWDQAFLLAALGASGRRTYGGGKKVFPDDDNFCLAAKKNLFTKLKYRRPFYTGTHRGLDGITLARGDRLVVESPARIPLQMDGEVVWLDPENFPLELSVADRGLHVLTLA